MCCVRVSFSQKVTAVQSSTYSFDYNLGHVLSFYSVILLHEPVGILFSCFSVVTNFRPVAWSSDPALSLPNMHGTTVAQLLRSPGLQLRVAFYPHILVQF